MIAACGAALPGGRQRDRENGLLETEPAQLLRNFIGQRLAHLATGLPKFRRRAVERFPRRLLALGQRRQKFGPAFQRGEIALRLRTEGEHVLDRAAIFAFEALHEVQALFQLAQLRRIEIDPFRPGAHGVQQFGQLGDGVAIEAFRICNGGVHPLPRCQRALDLRQLRQDRTFGFAEQPGDDSGLLDNLRGMGSRAVLVIDARVFSRFQTGRRDFLDLMPQKREPLLPFRLAQVEGRLFLLDLP